MRDALEQIAREVRVDFEDNYDWRENPDSLDLQCSGMSRVLHQKLTEAGFKAIRRVGMYLGADEGYEPDMTLWSAEEVADFDPAEGFNHWWVEVEGTIVDICSDQFHPTEREPRRVVLLPVGDDAYLPAPSTTRADHPRDNQRIAVRAAPSQGTDEQEFERPRG